MTPIVVQKRCPYRYTKYLYLVPYKNAGIIMNSAVHNLSNGRNIIKTNLNSNKVKIFGDPNVYLYMATSGRYTSGIIQHPPVPGVLYPG